MQTTDYLMDRNLRLALLNNPVDTVKSVSEDVLRQIIEDTEGSENPRVQAIQNAALLESAGRWIEYGPQIVKNII